MTSQFVRYWSSLGGAELYMNPKKCEFNRDSVEYLGYIISENGVQINPKKLCTILDWPVLTSIKEIQQCLGFCNFNQHSIHKYSKIIMPLQNLMHISDDPFPNPLPPKALRSFKVLKSAFTLPLVLQPFNPLLLLTVITDTSDFTMAGIQIQPDNSGLLHPCSLYSQKWSPAEINYDTHNKELLVIIDCFQDMQSWLIGTDLPVTVISDYKNLMYFMQSRSLNHRQTCWALILQDFNFKLTWLPGSSNPIFHLGAQISNQKGKIH